MGYGGNLFYGIAYILHTDFCVYPHGQEDEFKDLGHQLFMSHYQGSMLLKVSQQPGSLVHGGSAASNL